MYASFTKFWKSSIVPYRRPPSRSRTNGEPYAGARTVCMPPISTLFAGLRACCVNRSGAVAWISSRHIPRGNRTRSPSTSAPASLNSLCASGASRKSIPTCSRIVSAFRSIISRPSSVSTSNGGSVRVMYGTRSGAEAARAACRPARPPVRLRGASGVDADVDRCRS